MAAIPAKPVLVADVVKARGIARAVFQPAGDGAGILESAERIMAGGAGDALIGGQAGFKKQLMAKADRCGAARNAISRIRCPRGRPWPV